MNHEYKTSTTLQKYYDKIFKDGKLVNIHIGMWGMSYNLTEEDIKLDTKLPETIRLGKKMLIKPAVYNKFKTLEQKIRKYLYTNSFAFPLVSQAHFVPKTKYPEVYKQLQVLRDEYIALADEFILNYEDYKQQALDFYRDNKDSVNIPNLERFYPSSQELRQKFYLDIVSFEISLPTSFAETDLHTELAREEAREEIASEYQKEYSRQLDTHMSKINDFVGQVTSTLRSTIAEHCNVALKKISKREVVSDANIRTLLNHINEFRSMNFVGDHSVEQELAKVETLLKTDTDFSSNREALGLLQQHLTNVVREAETLTDVATPGGEYFRKLSL